MRQTATAERIKRELSDVEVPAGVHAALQAWFSADQAFNFWFLETTKGQLDDAKLLGLVEGYGGDQDAVEAAWDAWFKTRDDAAFVTALAASCAKMDVLKLK